MDACRHTLYHMTSNGELQLSPAGLLVSFSLTDIGEKRSSPKGLGHLLTLALPSVWSCSINEPLWVSICWIWNKDGNGCCRLPCCSVVQSERSLGLDTVSIPVFTARDWTKVSILITHRGLETYGCWKITLVGQSHRPWEWRQASRRRKHRPRRSSFALPSLFICGTEFTPLPSGHLTSHNFILNDVKSKGHGH